MSWPWSQHSCFTLSAVRLAAVRGAIACAWLGLSGPSFGKAQQTPAATRIDNVATLTRVVDGRLVVVESNIASLTIDALIDVAVVARADVVTLADNGGDTVLSFDVINTGNASERFALVARGADGTPLALGDGIDSIELRPGEIRTVPVTVPAASPNGRVVLSATAATGHGAPGTAFPGKDGDLVSVLGHSGGFASAATTILNSGRLPVLSKSFSVAAPDGSARAVVGSIITYRLTATAPGGARDAVILDAVPTGTRFVPGSILLDDRPQSDAADADAAMFDGTAVRVTLGDLPPASSRTVQFQVTIR